MEKKFINFIGCESSYQDANIVIFGAPFDGTTSYRPGTRFAPAAIRNESYGIETYSPYQDMDLADKKVFDSGDLELAFGNTERCINEIYDFTEKIVTDKKIPLMLGGEHLVSLGAIRAVHKKNPDLHIIHFDAHADLRKDYMGEIYSHATVMRRVWDLLGDNKIYQFGIRSGEREEFYWAKEHVYTNKFNFNTLDNVLEKISDKPIYLTVDLDVLDPSAFCGTGTPEAGGVSFTELLEACLKVSRLNVVGIDINELAPNYDASGASTLIACKMLRELLLANC